MNQLLQLLFTPLLRLVGVFSFIYVIVFSAGAIILFLFLESKFAGLGDGTKVIMGSAYYLACICLAVIGIYMLVKMREKSGVIYSVLIILLGILGFYFYSRFVTPKYDPFDSDYILFTLDVIAKIMGGGLLLIFWMISKKETHIP